MPSFNLQQEKAVKNSFTPLLIIAGAGTGKTHTLTGRLSYFIEQGVKPGKICAITFTNKAAREMRSRVKTKISNTEFFLFGKTPFIGTFHSLGVKILKEEAPLLGRGKNFTIFDDQDSWNLIKKIIKGMGKTKELITPAHLAHFISYKKSALLEKYPFSSQAQQQLLEEGREEYERKLTSHNAFDFDDLVFQPYYHLTHNKEVLKKYQNFFEHFLVDEYQDINQAQQMLVKTLAAHTNQVTVVGDENQTIYSWRGSNTNFFLSFPKEWPEATVVVLNDHYRSTQRIIEAASDLISHNKTQLFPEARRLLTKNKEGEKVVLYEAEDEESEAQWVARKIKEVRGGSSKKTIAILYRLNAQSRSLEQQLLRQGIAYRIFGGLKFYERREVRDVMSVLRLIFNPQDELSRERLYKNLTQRVWKKCEEELRGGFEKKPKELIESFLESSGYFERLEEQFLNFDERQENIRELLAFSEKFDSLGDFLSEVSLLQSLDASEGEVFEYPPVVLSTVHLAKGLEFDAVFVVGCNEGVLPHFKSLEVEAQLEEERRLLYVAMTRAKENLFLSFYNIPSRFLGEISQHHLDFQSEYGASRSLDDEERYITID